MILQALVKYYEDLAKLGKIPKNGWAEGKVTFAIKIDDEGNLKEVINLMVEEERNKKKILVPRNILIPAPVKRSSGVTSNFLCDNSDYILGLSSKGKPDRTAQCWADCKRLHSEILSSIDISAVKALLKFFEKWNPSDYISNDVITLYIDDILSGCNITFMYGDVFLVDIPEIASAWDEYYMSDNDMVYMPCLVTGKNASVEAVHPAIKGVKDSQSSGAALISFNAPAFLSYGKEQNYNSPVSKYAAFAYTTALNHLLSDRANVNYIGDTAVLFWAEGGEQAFRNLANMSLFGVDEKYTNIEIQNKVKRIAEGKSIEFEETLVNPERKFYVLGLAPNAARLSVRFFWHNSFGSFMRNINEHYKRLEIIRPEYDSFQEIPLWKLLSETVNQNSKNKAASPVMSGQLLQAILTDGRYPATLLNNVNIRIRADRKINYCRAAIIKSYYLKNKNKDVPEEVLQVALNNETTNVPYNLGRLFSILENIQQKANPGINTTIRDKYFNSASATPASVFPIILNLSQKHLSKIGGGLQVVLAKEMQDVIDKLGVEFPKRMNLAEQGSFQLGYYHQTQARYQGKNKEEK